jgi:hypothetical protein
MYLNYVTCVEEGAVVPAEGNFELLTDRKTKRKRHLKWWLFLKLLKHRFGIDCTINII